jgi:hypothetical protein
VEEQWDRQRRLDWATVIARRLETAERALAIAEAIQIEFLALATASY